MKEEKLKQLLDRYYDGNTTSEEEKELKEYFSGTDIFPGYELKKKFSGIMTGLKEFRFIRPILKQGS